MRGIYRNIAILLALSALAVTGVASTAEAGRGSAVGAAAAKMSRGAQIRLNRMKQKMSLRTRGALQQKSRRQVRLSKTKMMRAMSRRDVGLDGSEAERTRERFARSSGGSSKNNQQDEELERSVKQQKKMRDRSVRRALKAFNKMRRRNRD